jgi:hypothetical protein
VKRLGTSTRLKVDTIKQIARESRTHKVILDIIFDELTTQSKINPALEVNYGYKKKTSMKEYPDIIFQNGAKKYAISIITNVKPNEDSKLAKQLIQRHHYFIEQDMEPIWFIEKKEHSVEVEKNSIVLWDAEITIASKTYEDDKWDSVIEEVAEDIEFFQHFSYPVTMPQLCIDVRSMYYVYANEDKIVIKVQRFLKDKLEKPYRAFLINEGYELPFGDALIMRDEFLLCKPELEEQNRLEFVQRYLTLLAQHHEQQRLKEEERQRQLIEEEERKEIIRKRRLEQTDVYAGSYDENMSYQDLKSLLREKIQLKQKEQMELWYTYMPLVGYKNSYLVWNLVVEHKCKDYSALKSLLNKEYGHKNRF